MKKLIILPLFFLCFEAFACGGYADLYPKWSIGVIGVGSYSLPATGFQPYFLPGVQFTHTRGMWAQRFAVEQVRHTIENNETGGADMLATNGTERRTMIRIGLERGWYLHRLFRPYVAMDIAGQLYKSDIDYEGGIAGMNQNVTVNSKGIGLIPTVGFKTYIGKKISLYAEYRAEAFVNDETRMVTYKSGIVDTRPVNDTKFDFNAGSIAQVGVQVMF